MAHYDIEIRGHSTINFEKLREQRDTLTELAHPEHAEDNLPPEQLDAVKGVRNLLDAMLDTYDWNAEHAERADGEERRQGFIPRRLQNGRRHGEKPIGAEELTAYLASDIYRASREAVKVLVAAGFEVITSPKSAGTQVSIIVTNR